MGWDVVNVHSGIKTKDFVKYEYSRMEAYEVLAIGQGKRIHDEVPFYLAMKNRSTGDVSALVVLTRRKNGQVALKDIWEEMGPFVTDCPANVFKLLTPITSEWANQWREKVAA